MYQLTEKQILELAALSPEVKSQLVEYFPAIFTYDMKNLKCIGGTIPTLAIQEPDNPLGTRILVSLYRGSIGSVYDSKAFALDPNSDWQIITETDGTKLLVPTKK